jgi:molybdate transport system ATP-binding protein
MHLLVDIGVRQGTFSLTAEFDFWGSALGVFGPSGSGKSTLIRAIAGLVKPECGIIKVDGEIFFDSLQDIWIPPHERRVGVVFQDARLFPHWSTEKNLRAGMALETTGIFAFDRIVDLLEIRSLLLRPVQNLSGGEKQRIALGRALLAHPRLLLMDEPVSGLDAGMKRQILPFLKRVHQELHLPCVMVSHYVPEIMQITDQLLLVRKGEIYGQSSVEDLLLHTDSFDLLRRSGLMSTLNLPSGPAGVRPDEVILATRPVAGLSAQHCISGTLRRMVVHGGTILCLIDTDHGRLMADVTPAAVQELGLCNGGPVWCLFKTHAIHSVE